MSGSNMAILDSILTFVCTLAGVGKRILVFLTRKILKMNIIVSYFTVKAHFETDNMLQSYSL